MARSTRPADGKRRISRALWFDNVDGGEVTAEEEMRLGVSLIPGWVTVRSSEQGAPANALGTGAPLLLSVVVLSGAALAMIALTVAAVTGLTPLAGAIGIALLVPAAVIDIEQRRIPDAWVVSGGICVIVTLVVDSVVGQPNEAEVLPGTALGAIAMTLPVLALHLVSPASMGFGDVKAAVVLGAAIGTTDARLAAVALCLAAAGGATVGLAARRRTIPFGPFLVSASVLVVLTHDTIVGTIFLSGAPT